MANVSNGREFSTEAVLYIVSGMSFTQQFAAECLGLVRFVLKKKPNDTVTLGDATVCTEHICIQHPELMDDEFHYGKMGQCPFDEWMARNIERLSQTITVRPA